MNADNMTYVRRLRATVQLLAVAASTILLAGCFGDELSDLKEYVASVKARPAAKIPPLPTFESYVTVTYDARNMRGPFTPPDVADEPVKKENDSVNNHGPRPPKDRKLEPLEVFPLDALRFVGLLERASTRWAIIAAPDKMIHHVRVGDHMGQNYGKVTSISEARIELVEIIEDGMGGWSERPASLSVVE